MFVRNCRASSDKPPVSSDAADGGTAAAAAADPDKAADPDGGAPWPPASHADGGGGGGGENGGSADGPTGGSADSSVAGESDDSGAPNGGQQAIAGSGKALTWSALQPLSSSYGKHGGPDSAHGGSGGGGDDETLQYGGGGGGSGMLTGQKACMLAHPQKSGICDMLGDAGPSTSCSLTHVSYIKATPHERPALSSITHELLLPCACRRACPPVSASRRYTQSCCCMRTTAAASRPPQVLFRFALQHLLFPRLRPRLHNRDRRSTGGSCLRLCLDVPRVHPSCENTTIYMYICTLREIRYLHAAAQPRSRCRGIGLPAEGPRNCTVHWQAVQSQSLSQSHPNSSLFPIRSPAVADRGVGHPAGGPPHRTVHGEDVKVRRCRHAAYAGGVQAHRQVSVFGVQLKRPSAVHGGSVKSALALSGR